MQPLIGKNEMSYRIGENIQYNDYNAKCYYISNEIT